MLRIILFSLLLIVQVHSAIVYNGEGYTSTVIDNGSFYTYTYTITDRSKILKDDKGKAEKMEFLNISTETFNPTSSLNFDFSNGLFTRLRGNQNGIISFTVDSFNSPKFDNITYGSSSNVYLPAYTPIPETNALMFTIVSSLFLFRRKRVKN